MVLALCGYDINHARRDYQLLQSFPDFDSIPAALDGEIYLVNASAYFARPGPRIVDSLEILAGILHPRKFPEFASRRPDDPRFILRWLTNSSSVRHVGAEFREAGAAAQFIQRFASRPGIDAPATQPPAPGRRRFQPRLRKSGGVQ